MTNSTKRLIFALHSRASGNPEKKNQVLTEHECIFDLVNGYKRYLCENIGMGKDMKTEIQKSIDKL